MPPSPLSPDSARHLFGLRLQVARKASGLTQQQLGMRIGLGIDVAATRINRYERGVHDADSATAEQLAEQLGLPLAYFYADSEALAEAVRTFARLTPAKQEKALQALRALSENMSEA